MKISIVALVAASISLAASRALPADNSLEAGNPKHGQHLAANETAVSSATPTEDAALDTDCILVNSTASSYTTSAGAAAATGKGKERKGKDKGKKKGHKGCAAHNGTVHAHDFAAHNGTHNGTAHHEKHHGKHNGTAHHGGHNGTAHAEEHKKHKGTATKTIDFAAAATATGAVESEGEKEAKSEPTQSTSDATPETKKNPISALLSKLFE